MAKKSLLEAYRLIRAIALQEREAPEFLYHYSGKQSLLGILEERALHASNVRYLNDTSELELAKTLAWKLVEKHGELHGSEDGWAEFAATVKDILFTDIEKYHDSFVFSLSALHDDIPQWRAYGNDGNGYAIGFNGKELEEIASFGQVILSPCVYDDQLQHQILNQVIEESYEARRHGRGSFFEPLFLFAGPLIKDKRYEHESEWRLVTYGLNVRDRDVRFKLQGSTLTPYWPIKFELTETTPDGLPIRQIVVGPGCDFELEGRALTGLLTLNDGAHVEIVRSEVPYRGGSA